MPRFRLAIATLLAWAGAVNAEPATWGDVLAQPQPATGEIIHYGPHGDQFAELLLPPGDGPHPVLVLIHGGCWLQQFDVQLIRPLAAAIRDLGWAVWLPEYRRLGGAGGYPGTLLDIADAIDVLRQLAPQRSLDLGRLAAAGHSAGGHLALWSATRHRFDPGHELHHADPLLPRKVIGLAAIGDLASYRVGPPNSCHASVDKLLGGSPDTVPARYAAASPRQRLPLAAAATLIHGTDDPIVPLQASEAFARASRRAGIVRITGAGHFDLVIPRGAAWIALRSELASVSE